MTTGIAVLFYDYFMTFDVEIAEIWGNNFTGATALFVLHEYSTLASWAMTTFLDFDPSRVNLVRTLRIPSAVNCEFMNVLEGVSSMFILAKTARSNINVFSCNGTGQTFNTLQSIASVTAICEFFRLCHLLGLVSSYEGAVILGLRTSAIYQNRWIVICGLVSLGLAYTGMFIVRKTSGRMGPNPKIAYGCKTIGV